MLKDCSPLEIDAFALKYFGGKTHKKKVEALAWLSRCSREIKANELTFSLGGSKKERDHEPVFYANTYGEWWVGRYIGTFTFEGKTIDIEPRFPLEFIVRQLPLNKFALVDVKGKSVSGKVLMHYLQALIWFNLFQKAAKHSLPLMKKTIIHEGKTIKGRLDIRRTLRSRTSKPDVAVSTYETKTLNNPLSTIIGLAFVEIKRWFPTHNLLQEQPTTIALRLQQIENIVPRTKKIPSQKELNSIRYNSITAPYKPLLKLSLEILKSRGISVDSDSTGQTKGILIDVAEIWERYVQEVLENIFHDDFQVIDGNQQKGDFLLTAKETKKHLGKLKPDFWIEKYNGQKLVIADAKYKKLGDQPWQSPKRDDLYQMSAYLDRYSTDFHERKGKAILVYPKWKENEFSEIEIQSPWALESGAELSFVTLSTNLEDAVNDLKRLGGIKA